MLAAIKSLVDGETPGSYCIIKPKKPLTKSMLIPGK
jgi:hypothetical protein